MPEPNERQIEKLLNAVASRRREQAGTPEMHPAVREILQTEVRRQYGPAPGRARSGFRRLIGVLPKVAALAVLGVCGWLLLSRHSGEAPARVATEMEPQLIPPADKKPLPAAEPASAVVEATGEPRGDRIAGGLTPVQSRAPASPAPRTSSAVKLAAAAAGRMETGQGAAKSVVGPDYFKADRQGMYMGTATVEAESKEGIVADEDVALAALMEPPKGGRPAPTTSRVASAPGSLKVPVLQTFTVFNQGHTVRVVDADGSTYEGTFQPVAAVASGSTGSLRDVETVAAAKGSTAKLASTSGLAGVVLLNYDFVVSGTNRSLGEALRFSGKLALSEQQLDQGQNSFSNTIVPVAGEQPETPSAAAGEFTNGRLQGTAVLSNGKDVPVDAVPTAP